MKKTELMTKATRAFHRTGLKIRKHSPEILVVTGVIGTAVAAVMACKATLKVNEVLDNTKENIEKIHEATEKGCTAAGADYSEEDSKKDLTTVYVQTGWEFVKLYGPSVAVGALSATAILAGHNILRKRNVAIAAAYTALDTSFKDYRGRVVERFGKELDRELRYNIKTEEVDKIVVNEDGSESVTKETIEVIDPNNYSPDAKFFDVGNEYWEKDPELNLMFLRRQQAWANDKLKDRGHLFLNEVYDMLGLPRTARGQQVGWIYDEKNPIGDNFVDFGIYDIHKPANRDFVNGYERTILLDFNHDGIIMDFI